MLGASFLSNRVEKSLQRIIDIGEWTARKRSQDVAETSAQTPPEPAWNHLMPFVRPGPSPETVGLEQEEADFVDHYLALADSLLSAPIQIAAKSAK